ncbi:MAG: hypothetical protein GY793_06470 [Proteobacteria bacterium]|nr:hypothetical protein [Pseudomonadota bacterium]
MKGVRISFVVTAIILFVSSYWICDYFYYYIDGGYDSKGWWGLKSKIYAVIMALIFASNGFGLNKDKWLRFVCEVGAGFAISNLIDKCYYNVLVFTSSDVYMILITVAFATYNLAYGKQQRPSK